MCILNLLLNEHLCVQLAQHTLSVWPSRRLRVPPDKQTNRRDRGLLIPKCLKWVVTHLTTSKIQYILPHYIHPCTPYYPHSHFCTMHSACHASYVCHVCHICHNTNPFYKHTKILIMTFLWRYFNNHALIIVFRLESITYMGQYINNE